MSKVEKLPEYFSQKVSGRISGHSFFNQFLENAIKLENGKKALARAKKEEGVKISMTL